MNRWDEYFARAEKILVVFLLSIMILLAFLQIVLRNFFATGLSWGDEVVRYLVLWVGFIGATLAAKEGKHINMEVFSRWVFGRGRIYLNGISLFCSAFICGLLTFAALKFVHFEAQMESTTFLGLPVWLPELIIPMTFGLMAFRFAIRFFMELAKIQDPKSDPQNIKAP
jgi:C4-dicarboxylate transporter DctQ subunit